MRGETDDWVTLAANSILRAVVTEAATKDLQGPFTLDDFLQAWLDHAAALIEILPDPPRSKDRSAGQARTYWFYEGCHALEEGARIAEVGDGKFVIASLGSLVAQVRHAEAARHD